MANTITNIRKALHTFGCKGKATIEYIAADRVRVSVNGEYFGIWDVEKKTFVD